MNPAWEPTREERADTVTEAAAAALHDLLDTGGKVPRHGDPLPILWHWLAFLPQAPQSQLGPDGHPRTGTFLPPTGDRQRMYAGGKVTVEGTPLVGERLARVSEVTDVSHKTGRSGELMFVTVDHRITARSGAITDRNDIVYKASTRGKASAPAGGQGPEVGWDWGRTVAVDPALLFRFSALTYNAHRIHYDRGYATGTEGYPGLVVHGPLQAVLLADAVALAAPGRTPTAFTFRSTAPAYDTAPLELRALTAEEDGTIVLAAYSNGIQTMTATAALTPGKPQP